MSCVFPGKTNQRQSLKQTVILASVFFVPRWSEEKNVVFIAKNLVKSNTSCVLNSYLKKLFFDLKLWLSGKWSFIYLKSLLLMKCNHFAFFISHGNSIHKVQCMIALYIENAFLFVIAQPQTFWSRIYSYLVRVWISYMQLPRKEPIAGQFLQWNKEEAVILLCITW